MPAELAAVTTVLESFILQTNMKLQNLIETHWYSRLNPVLAFLLYPASLIYAAVVKIRRWLFKIGFKPIYSVPVPVVVVGNIGVGGAGKTPLTKYLLQTLQDNGIKVGVILRGYKSTIATPHLVVATDESDAVGDEALIYAQAGFKVAIAAKRIEAAKLLLQTFPEIQLIIADDGMQHYYLARDFEICVVDGTRYFGNQSLLPNGPLREPLSRLNSVNAVVINSEISAAKRPKIFSRLSVPVYTQSLEFIDLYNPQSQQSCAIRDFSARKIMALAAIGNPQRFFDYLQEHGIKINATRVFPDHYHYKASDIDSEYAIITTEKDYTKLAKFKKDNIWIARVQAKLDSNQLVTQIINLLEPHY